MPQVVNGIGTWYTGKVNVLSRQDTCDNCNKEATLTSYDTTLYVVVFFIPIIPLGKKRVIDECSSCRQHRVMPLAQWESLKQKAFEEATAEWRQTPTDPAAARKLINTYMGFHDNAAFMRAVPEIIGHLGGNAEILRVIGSTYMLFGNYTQAEQILRVLLDVEDSRQGREMLAETLIRQKRPQEAEPYLQHVIEEELSDRVWLLYLCAQGCQSVGDHARALALLEQCKAIMPQIEQNKDFKKTRKVSEKNRGGGKAIKIKGLESGLVTADAGGRKRARLAMLVGPIILAVILFFYFGAAYQKGKAREVFVVNGLSKPYVANINGAKVTLAPARPTRITIPEGEVTVKSADPAVEFPESKFRIETSFWVRPFLDRDFVINPDQTAGVVWMRTHYSANPRSAPPAEAHAHFGKALHEFSGVDYPFEFFPKSIKVSSSGSTAKERLYLLNERGEPIFSALDQLASMAGADAAAEFAKRHLAVEPEAAEYVWYLSAKLAPEELIETVKPGLAKRPILLEWHRIYQTAREKTGNEGELEAEYRKLAEAEPGDPALMYLAGRATKDRAASLEWFRKSAAAEPPCAAAHNALAWDALTQADFAPAAESAVKALELEPGNLAYREMALDALAAAGRLEEGLALARKLEAAHPKEYRYGSKEIQLLCALGRSGEAEGVIARAAVLIESDYGKAAIASFRDSWEGLAAYCSGDAARAAICYERLPEHAHSRTFVPIMKGDLAGAEKALGEPVEEETLPPEERAKEWLILAAGYHAAGDADGTARAIAKAAPLLGEGDKEAKLAAGLLAGESQPNEAEVLGMTMEVGMKKLVLVGLGAKHPGHRKAFFELARKLNFELDYPHLTIKSATEKE